MTAMQVTGRFAPLSVRPWLFYSWMYLTFPAY